MPTARISPGMSCIPRGMRHDMAPGTRKTGMKIQQDGSKAEGKEGGEE